MNDEEGEQCCDEDAADRADDRTGRLYIASVHDELGRERDGGADEDCPEEDVCGREEDERDQPLCDEEDGKEEDEECLCARPAPKEDEERGKAEQQQKDGGQPVIVGNGVARTLRAHDEAVALLRVDVECGVVQRAMDDHRLCATVRTGVEADAYVVLLAAGGKRLDLVLRLRDVQHLGLVRRRIAVLAGGQAGGGVEHGGESKADAEDAGGMLRMDLHERCLSLGG